VETLLIVGVDSVVGANLACTLSDRFQVIGLSQSGDFSLEGCQTFDLPFDDSGRLGQAILDASPAWIVHCGALARCSWDEITKDCLRRLRAEPQLVVNVAKAAEQLGCRLTVISSDAVFAGPRVFHHETSPTTGLGPIGTAALETEAILAGSRALVARTHAYGWSPATEASHYANSFFEALDRGDAAQADGRRYATPILSSDLAELLCQAYRCKLEGLFHIAGAERTSPSRFVAEMAAACLIDGWRNGEASEAINSPTLQVPETSLICRRVRQALGQPAPMLREGLTRFAEQLENGYRERVRGATEPVRGATESVARLSAA